ncbi:MAG: choice-of-anchor tandem repeat GloVer-containing protein [Candidatus Cybelea sp.]|jgi:uncharacterized repeat protein (TIGR03803 family)
MIDLRRYELVVIVAMLAGCSGSGTPLSPSPSGVTAEHARPNVLERVLWAFKGSPNDGAHPEASVVNVNGKLYGTTSDGGNGNVGTVFSITTSGKEIVLHSFGGAGDGANPLAGLLNVDGTLYGTTSGGGADLDGTVFAITASGTETVLYSFKADSADGAHPQAGLLAFSLRNL